MEFNLRLQLAIRDNLDDKKLRIETLREVQEDMKLHGFRQTVILWRGFIGLPEAEGADNENTLPALRRGFKFKRQRRTG